MPNLNQLISLRKKYKSTVSADIAELEEYLNDQQIKRLTKEDDRLEKSFMIHKTVLESYTPSAITAEVKRFFDTNAKANVALLFIDIANFTTVTSSRTTSEIKDILNAYFNIVMKIIYKHGGEVEKTMGDGIICVFGEPFLTGTEVQLTRTAERCAIEIIETLYDKLDVKVALHYGEVIFYKTNIEFYEEYTMFGQTLTELFRLEASAAKNTITFFNRGKYAVLVNSMGQPVSKESKLWRVNTGVINMQGLGNQNVSFLKYR